MKINMTFELEEDYQDFLTIAKAFERQKLTHALQNYVGRYIANLEDGNEVQSPKAFADHVYDRLMKLID